MGVVRMYRWLVGVIRRYIDSLIILLIPVYSTCISSFFASASLLLCSFFKCFFFILINLSYTNDLTRVQLCWQLLLKSGSEAS